MLISHELPIGLFSDHSTINDYPYLLAHLLLKKYNLNEEYAEFYKEYCKTQEYVLADNSCYELGKPVNAKDLLKLVNDYNISHIVVPDAYKNKDETIAFAEKYIPQLYNKSKAKLFAVAQGQTITEVIECFQYFNSKKEIDIIGINFALGEEAREQILRTLKPVLETGTAKQLHLLGTANPYKLWDYAHEFAPFIKSVDTSNPIMMALENRVYLPSGEKEYKKPEALLAESLNKEITNSTRMLALKNTRIFRRRLRKSAI